MKRFYLSACLLLILTLTVLTGCKNTPPTQSPPPLDDTCTHQDTDKNDRCDHCGGDITVLIDFYAINDLHGKFADSDSQPGVDELTTYLKAAMAADDMAFLLSSGDMWQGSAESNLTGGFVITEWMNELDFTSMTLGNHEFDWGVEKILSNAALAEFPFLAINIIDTETNERAAFCDPSVLVEQNGIKIGIIGAIGDCYSSVSADKVVGYRFATGIELTSLVKAESRRLREAGADMIVYSIHGDEESYDTALSRGGYVDVVFEGHTHQDYARRDSSGVWHLQNGGYNYGISHIELRLNFVNDTVKVTEGEVIGNRTWTAQNDDPIVEQLLQKYDDEIAIAYKVLGTNTSRRDGDWLRQQIANAYYDFALKKWGDSYDIVLGGGYLSIRSPGQLPAGEITYGQLLDLFPFDNQLVLCSIKGADLQSRFFETDNTSYFISYGDYGAAVRDNIDPGATYYIVVDTYSSFYAPNRLTEIERHEAPYYARDLLAEFIAAGGMDGGQENYTLTAIPELTAIGNALADNATTTASYYVKGRIVSIESATYGNLYIEDENGDRFYIWGIYDKKGTRYDAMTDKPQVGDTIVVTGVLKKYVKNATASPVIEMINATLIEKS